ncbi:MAG TPA: efflux RND transporter periplasmic adaptor subunit [Anaeromyxobacteraceae bacterium]|nr:efflux RND transporter periplasmic adaptor subunit [Anaeromyxobacteraceae bacterium]
MTKLARPAVLAAAVLGAASLAACGHKAEKASLPETGAVARAVKVGKPSTRLETGLARATGTVRARDEAVLAAKASGQIKRVRVQVGDRVRAHQPLVEMDAALAAIAVDNGRAAVRLAEANLASAEREVKRGQALNAEQAMADAGLDRVKTAQELAAAQLDQARAALRMAEQNLADTVIAAPFDGVVTAKLKNAGDSVTGMPVTPIVAVTDVDHLEVRLAVPEGVEPFVQPGQKVIGVTTPGGQRFEARVRVKNAVVDAASRTVEVLADVAKVDGGALRPGTLVNVDFGGFGDKDGLYVPANAVRSDGSASYVFVIASGKAERRAIKAVPVNPGVFAVEGGLDPATAVILDPGTLAAGDAVVPLAD